MALEAFRRSLGRVRYHNPGFVEARPSHLDSEFVDLVDRAFVLAQSSNPLDARPVYIQAAERAMEMFESIPVRTGRARRDRGEYGVAAVSGFVSAHANDRARELAERLHADPHVPASAQARAGTFVGFLDQHPDC